MKLILRNIFLKIVAKNFLNTVFIRNRYPKLLSVSMLEGSAEVHTYIKQEKMEVTLQNLSISNCRMIKSSGNFILNLIKDAIRTDSSDRYQYST